MTPSALKPLLSIGLLALGGAASAQEPVQQALDGCIRGEQRESRLIGSVLGALGGLSLGGDSDRRTSAGLRIGVGGGTGGALGQASAYFNAVGNCFKKHPEWIPASRLERGDGYRVAMTQASYSPDDGVVALATQIDAPATARPEARLELRSRFLLLTPHGAEAQVQIERKLFVIADEREAALTLPAQASEQRTLAAGEHWDVVTLPIPKDAPLGVAYRLEFSVSVPQRPASTARATVKVL